LPFVNNLVAKEPDAGDVDSSTSPTFMLCGKLVADETEKMGKVVRVSGARRRADPVGAMSPSARSRSAGLASACLFLRGQSSI
jgi:hypothetical protein